MKTNHWKIFEIEDHIGSRLVIRKNDYYHDVVLITETKSKSQAMEEAKELIKKSMTKKETLLEEIIESYE